MANPHVDVLIVGAGVSGIGMACRLSRECPGKRYLILERRQAIGGTWDLFRYPGVRSDSDMLTFGYDFRPWTDTKVLADGTSIRKYVRDTAQAFGIEEHIRFGLQVRSASWSSARNRWRIVAVDEASGEDQTFTADVLVGATGYYNYDRGYRPEFPGEGTFTGRLVHPQFWPADLDHTGKKVVIIGSGATAITLVPAMAADAERVTMLQRSPTYVASLPADDAFAAALGRVLPERIVYSIARARNIAVQRGSYAFARWQPVIMRRVLLGAVRKHLGTAAGIENFSPSYDPWDQRLCVVPDGDLFRAIRTGRAEVVTDTIETFTEHGVRLASGREIEADVIVTATGLDVQLLGGAQVDVDGEPFLPNRSVTYKAVLPEGVPNAAMIFGYTNASWTLKADIAAGYVCRLLNHLETHGRNRFVVHASDADRDPDTSVFGTLDSGYVRRGADRLPRQGTNGPWKVRNDYLRDRVTLIRGAIEDGVLELSTVFAHSVTDESTHASA